MIIIKKSLAFIIGILGIALQIYAVEYLAPISTLNSYNHLSYWIFGAIFIAVSLIAVTFLCGGNVFIADEWHGIRVREILKRIGLICSIWVAVQVSCLFLFFVSGLKTWDNNELYVSLLGPVYGLIKLLMLLPAIGIIMYLAYMITFLLVLVIEKRIGSIGWQRITLFNAVVALEMEMIPWFLEIMSKNGSHISVYWATLAGIRM
jgi:hypothetical protein